MNWSFRFAYPLLLYGLVPLVLLALWYRAKRYKASLYCFPLLQQMHDAGITAEGSWRGNFSSIVRFLLLTVLALLIARPQRIDEQSKVLVEGIDIMLVLDVSASMQLFDDPKERKQRITIAKEEAINFLKKRLNDPIGLVIFGREAVSRCPLTLDKTVLESIINDIQLGVINAEGTMLSKALMTALGRLRASQAKSKVIILLTDGEPTPGDLHPDDAIFLAKKYGVKIYTIGIGGKYGGLLEHPLYGLQQAGVPLNTRLLEKFATQTGGKAFLVTNQKELQTVYDTIDRLEKTEYETDVYHNYEEIVIPFLWILLVAAFLAMLVETCVWFRL